MIDETLEVMELLRWVTKSYRVTYYVHGMLDAGCWVRHGVGMLGWFVFVVHCFVGWFGVRGEQFILYVSFYALLYNMKATSGS